MNTLVSSVNTNACRNATNTSSSMTPVASTEAPMPDRVALEQEGEPDQRQHQHVARGHVGEEPDRQGERLGQLADQLDRRHDREQHHLEDGAADAARAARGGR